jgi:hypothetical protein
MRIEKINKNGRVSQDMNSTNNAIIRIIQSLCSSLEPLQSEIISSLCPSFTSPSLPPHLTSPSILISSPSLPPHLISPLPYHYTPPSPALPYLLSFTFSPLRPDSWSCSRSSSTLLRIRLFFACSLLRSLSVCVCT